MTLGHDPEIFITDKDGKFVCPSAMIRESKKYIEFSPLGGFNRDGMAMELNPIPVDSPEALSYRTGQLGATLCTAISKFNWNISMALGINLDEANKSTIAEDVFESGCAPDYNAYTGDVNRVTVNPKTFRFRFAGGHLSFGVGPIDWETACDMVKRLDQSVGLLSIVHSHSYFARMRRMVYGRAGDFRYNGEKLEYRTPDAAWLYNGQLTNLLYMGLKALRGDLPRRDEKQTIQAINSCNNKLASSLLGL